MHEILQQQELILVEKGLELVGSLEMIARTLVLGVLGVSLKAKFAPVAPQKCGGAALAIGCLGNWCQYPLQQLWCNAGSPTHTTWKTAGTHAATSPGEDALATAALYCKRMTPPMHAILQICHRSPIPDG